MGNRTRLPGLLLDPWTCHEIHEKSILWGVSEESLSNAMKLAACEIVMGKYSKYLSSCLCRHPEKLRFLTDLSHAIQLAKLNLQEEVFMCFQVHTASARAGNSTETALSQCFDIFTLIHNWNQENEICTRRINSCVIRTGLSLTSLNTIANCTDLSVRSDDHSE